MKICICKENLAWAKTWLPLLGIKESIRLSDDLENWFIPN